MRYNFECKGHGCKYKTMYFACIQKHSTKCIKKFKWEFRRGFMSAKMLEININHVKEMGFKQT